MNLDTTLTCFRKFNSKSIIDVNANWEIIKTVKLVDDNMEENLDDFGYDDEFLGTTSNHNP